LVDIKTERPYYDKNILRGGAENIGGQIKTLQVIQMVAAEKTITSETLDEEAVCPECLGTGMVSYWSEIAYFEDRRACARCETGGKVDTKIADIVKRARLEDRLSGI
jgi:RecJ-like exonuclease